ncbi:hypothetical protein ACVIM9_008251 [Bradyrhizobium sp. USDA 4520]
MDYRRLRGRVSAGGLSRCQAGFRSFRRSRVDYRLYRPSAPGRRSGVKRVAFGHLPGDSNRAAYETALSRCSRPSRFAFLGQRTASSMRFSGSCAPEHAGVICPKHLVRTSRFTTASSAAGRLLTRPHLARLADCTTQLRSPWPPYDGKCGHVSREPSPGDTNVRGFYRGDRTFPPPPKITARSPAPIRNS